VYRPNEGKARSSVQYVRVKLSLSGDGQEIRDCGKNRDGKAPSLYIKGS